MPTPTRSAKAPQINRKTGDFYLFGNDIKRGLDIYHFDGEARSRRSRGKWMSAQEANRAREPAGAGRRGHDLHLPARRIGRPPLDSRRCCSPAERSERWTRLPP